jgi:beta-barrel assembly-enhancing protease
MIATCLFRRVSVPGLVLFAAILTGCSIPVAQEIEMGRDVAPQFEEEFGGLHPDSHIQQYVSDIGHRLVRFSGREQLPWSFGVLASDEINAFALPGGPVYITRGLLFNLENEAQLAAILAHEVVHIAERHSVEQLERAQILTGGTVLVGVLTGSGAVADVSGVVAGLMTMRYSREHEREADLMGLEYLARAGYRPEAMLEAMQIIRRLSEGGRPPEFLSTHPSPANREEYLSQAIQEQYARIISPTRTGEEEFRRNVLARR